jgi:hypothetical protein
MEYNDKERVEAAKEVYRIVKQHAEWLHDQLLEDILIEKRPKIAENDEHWEEQTLENLKKAIDRRLMKISRGEDPWQ